jgi:ribonuclease P protein component
LERSQSVGTWWQSVHLPKEERLSLKRQIEQLFSVGHSFIVYPIRIVYRPLTADEPPVTAILVSVSKRRFKRAVDRNRIRRLLREVYRLNKGCLTFGKMTAEFLPSEAITSGSPLPPPCAFHIAFIYVGNVLPTFAQLQKSMQRALLSIHKNSR